jgi:hypothetical protein
VTGVRCLGLARSGRALLALLIAGLVPLASPQGGELAAERPQVQLNAGVVGLLNRASNSWRYGGEYRFSPLGPWRLRPALGAVVAENDARYYFVGLRRDFPLSGRWVLTPGFDITSYDEGRGIDLGSELEFRSGLELSHPVHRNWRLGIGVYHLSNGGFGDRNPGTNSLVGSLVIPVGGIY